MKIRTKIKTSILIEFLSMIAILSTEVGMVKAIGLFTLAFGFCAMVYQSEKLLKSYE